MQSDKLRRYYRGVVVPHSSTALIDAGYERERFSHHELVHKFWKVILNTPSTADLSNKQFVEFIEDIKRICAVYLNYYIPDPDNN